MVALLMLIMVGVPTECIDHLSALPLQVLMRRPWREDDSSTHLLVKLLGGLFPGKRIQLSVVCLTTAGGQFRFL